MTIRTRFLERDNTLGRMFPGAQFGEHHSRVVRADPAAVWDAILGLRWSDLTITKPLMLLRGLGMGGLGMGGLGMRGADRRLLDGTGPVAPILLDRPRELVAVAIDRPWQLRPEAGPTIGDPAGFTAFAEPGWLKQGMDFVLTPVVGGTRVDTSTLCEATDRDAERRFRLYWLLIRPFSGLIRRDILAAVDRIARRSGAPAAR